MRKNRQIRLDPLEHGLLVRALYETWLDTRAAGVSAEDMGGADSESDRRARKEVDLEV